MLASFTNFTFVRLDLAPMHTRLLVLLMKSVAISLIEYFHEMNVSVLTQKLQTSSIITQI